MSAVLFPQFGDRRAIRIAEVGNAAYERAVSMGYCRLAARQFARLAKRHADSVDTPAQIAFRVVLPRRQGMSPGRGPNGGGRAA